MPTANLSKVTKHRPRLNFGYGIGIQQQNITVITLHFRYYIFCIRIINIQSVKILQMRHYFTLNGFENYGDSAILRTCQRQSAVIVWLWNRAPTLKYQSSYFTSEITYSVQNHHIQSVKTLQIRIILLWTALKTTASDFTMLEKIQQSVQLFRKFLRTKPHKNSCMQLVLTRANYLT